jgi:hypothetical protein
LRGSEIRQNDFGAFFGEELRRGVTNSGCAARNQRNFVLNATHCLPPILPGIRLRILPSLPVAANL